MFLTDENKIIRLKHRKKKNANLIYSGHALSCTSTKLSELKILTGRRQTSWVFRKHDRGYKLWTTKKQIPPVAGWRPSTRYLRILVQFKHTI